jgi:ABC-type cobalamin/Fe3+-siderophores transport system ATPase subunit
VERPDTGSISIDGYDLWQSEVEARKDLVYVPEHPDLTPYATIREILNLVCRLRNEPLDKGMDALKFFGLLEVASRTVRELSLGQRRRAVFAAALIGTPRYILLVVVSHTIEPFVDLTSQAITIKSGCAIHCPNLPIGSEKIFAILDNLAKGIIETKGIIER